MTEVKKKSDFVTLWLPIHDAMARFACLERMRESPSMINAAGQYPTASIQALIALKDKEKAFFAARPHKERLQ